MKQNNINNDIKADISFNNNSVIIQLPNKTLSNNVKSGDLSKEGLVPSEKLKAIKNIVNSLTALRIEETVKNKKNNNYYKNSSGYYGTDSFTIQIFDYDEANNQNNSSLFKEEMVKEFNNLQVKKKLSQFDFDKCSLELKKYYNFTSSVLISKIDYDPKLLSRSCIGDANIAYYSPVTGELLPFEKICNKTRLNIKFPIVDIEIDKQDYDRYKLQGFNIYDSNSKFYSSRCFPLENETSHGDITLNERHQNIYKNISMTCGDKCFFNEIDLNNYTVCDCEQSNSTQLFLEKVVFDTYSSFNFDIITCIENITPVFNMLKYVIF